MKINRERDRSKQLQTATNRDRIRTTGTFWSKLHTSILYRHVYALFVSRTIPHNASLDMEYNELTWNLRYQKCLFFIFK